MRRFSVFFLGALVMASIFAALSLGKAAAATGCFSDTNAHWAEAYICWLKDNGISIGYPDGAFKPENPITRAEMAAMLQRANAVPPQSGVILFSVGNANWHKTNANENVDQWNMGNITRFVKLSTGVLYFIAQPDFTPVLYGKSLEFLGVEFCYEAPTNAYLTYVEVATHTASNGPGDTTYQYMSTTNYVGQACRYFTTPAPVLLTTFDSITFSIGVDWLVANTGFDIGRTTFVFLPSGTSALVSAASSEDAVILQESTEDSPIRLP